MNKRVQFLKSLPNHPQKSPEWFSSRKNKITASNIGILLPKTKEVCNPYIKEYNLYDSFKCNDKLTCNPYQNKDTYIKERAGLIPYEFRGNIATNWGQKYEQIACDIYSMFYSKDVIEFGLIPHDTISWLGASPDGITPEGTMIEIKCPMKRKITGIPPLYYWQQVQIQLEVCQLEECDFFECEFVEYLTFEEFINDTIDDHVIYYKGIILQDSKGNYIYPDKKTISNITEITKLLETYTLTHDITFWKLVNVSNTKIYRDKEWFATVKPLLENDWNKIQELKKK